jgi:hypothetical protein
MKSTDIQNIINESLFDEVKKTILRENKEGDEVYHITCEGEPVETFENEDEAMSHLDIYKKKHPEKEFIIEKKKYNSPSDMIDKLDEMGEKLEVKENKTMETNKVTNFAQAVMDAKDKGLKSFKLNGEKHDVNESWKQLEEEELGDDHGQEYMEEESDIEESNAFVLAADAAKDAGKKEFEYPEGSGKMHKVTIKKDIEVNEEHEDDSYSTSNNDTTDEMKEGDECNECGGMMKEDKCDECGSKRINESKKRTLRLTESEMIKVISRMVNESVPGMAITKRAQDGSKKENDEYMKDVESKLKKASSFDGADNPEFPKQNGKGEKMVVNSTPEQDEYTATHRGGTLADLDYDQEPSDKFKERLKMALEGDPKMGNSQDAANVLKTDTGKNIGKTSVKKKEIEKKGKEVFWGSRGVQPLDVKTVNESKTNMSSILEEEIKRMKKMYGYDEKTQ